MGLQGQLCLSHFTLSIESNLICLCVDQHSYFLPLPLEKFDE